MIASRTWRLPLLLLPVVLHGCDRDKSTEGVSQEQTPTAKQADGTRSPELSSLAQFAEKHGAVTTWLDPIEEFGGHATLDFQRGLGRLEDRTVAFEAFCVDVLKSSAGLRVLLFPVNDEYALQGDLEFHLDVDESVANRLLEVMHRDEFATWLVAAKLRDLFVFYERGHHVTAVDFDSVEHEAPEVEHFGLSERRILRGTLLAIEIDPQWVPIDED